MESQESDVDSAIDAHNYETELVEAAVDSIYEITIAIRKHLHAPETITPTWAKNCQTALHFVRDVVGDQYRPSVPIDLHRTSQYTLEHGVVRSMSTHALLYRIRSLEERLKAPMFQNPISAITEQADPISLDETVIPIESLTEAATPRLSCNG